MSDVIIRDKAEYHARTTDQMERHLTLPPWSLRQKIALTCRILAAEGHESALAGQITARGERPGTYWMLSFGLGFDEARASNLVLVDDDLNLLEGDGMVNPSNRFHLWIYRRRPDVNAIVHTHPPYCSALSMTGQPLVASHMDTAMFYDDCAYLAEWPGRPSGTRKAGLFTRRWETSEPSCWLITASWSRPGRSRRRPCSQCSSSAQRACKSSPIDWNDQADRSAFAREAHDYRLKPRAVAATFHYFARRVLKHEGEVLE